MLVLESDLQTQETTPVRSALSLKNVLYATDLSSASHSALPYATAICRRFGSKLHVAHVLSEMNGLLMTGAVDYVNVATVCDDARADAHERLQQIKHCAGTIPCQTHVRQGSIWANLNQIVREEEIDLIVVGTHGRTGVGMLLLGSVAEEILRHASCPVLTVGPGVCGRAKLPELHHQGRELAPAELELQGILYATNLAPTSGKAASVAISLAQEFGARSILMHVLGNYVNPADRPGLTEKITEQLQALVPKDSTLAYAPEIVADFGSTWQCVVNRAAQRHADLIVLGVHSVPGTSHLPWSTVHRVVAYASCPVLTVPSGTTVE